MKSSLLYSLLISVWIISAYIIISATSKNPGDPEQPLCCCRNSIGDVCCNPQDSCTAYPAGCGGCTGEPFQP